MYTIRTHEDELGGTYEHGVEVVQMSTVEAAQKWIAAMCITHGRGAGTYGIYDEAGRQLMPDGTWA